MPKLRPERRLHRRPYRLSKKGLSPLYRPSSRTSPVQREPLLKVQHNVIHVLAVIRLQFMPGCILFYPLSIFYPQSASLRLF